MSLLSETMLPEIIEGNRHSDARGSVSFVNSFDFKGVQRFYTIQPELGIVRAWQGHQRESKWFYASKGSFIIQLIPLNAEGLPLEKAEPQTFKLTDSESKILKIPGGFLNGFSALEEGSVLTVFSDFSLEESKEDDIRVSLEKLPWIQKHTL